MQICAINSGYWETKAYNGQNQFKFRTKMDKGNNDIINTENTFKINFEGNEYILGDGAAEYTLDYDKTNNLLHKLSTYYCLHKFTQGAQEEYKIMVALPLNIYSSLKSTYESYLKTKDYFPFEVNGIKKHIKVSDCRAFPEGPAAIYSNNPQQYKTSIIGGLDIGSLTINGWIMNNLNLVKESVFTINAGTIILYNKLQKELNNRFLLNLREYEMPGIIQNGLPGMDISEIINNVIRDHLQEVILEMRKNNWPIETIKILCTGGGSLLLYEHLKKLLLGAFLGIDPVYDNVKGLYNIARMVFA